MPFDIAKLSDFPAKPGVYLMKNKSDKVLYVGKAKNLKSRVRQYFRGGDGRAMIPLLIAQVESIDTIVVSSEKEALLLEDTLIKQHKPKYNALLKDDKSYLSLMITKHRWPQIKLIRYKGKPKEAGRYFGPYTSGYAAKQTLDLIQRIFPLRRCSDNELNRRTRPCILHGMKRCCAPCVDKVTPEEYQEYVDKAKKFLGGKDASVLDDLHEEMAAAAEALEFERAGEILKAIKQIETTTEAQKVVKIRGADIDAIGLYRRGDEVTVVRMFYRGGKLVGSRSHEFTQLLDEDADLLATLLMQAYRGVRPLPHEILLPLEITTQTEIAELLGEGQPHKISLHVPQRGEKKRMVEMAYENAEAVHKRERNEETLRERTLVQLQEKFHLTNFPQRIECCDTSNISGSEPVASIVTFTDGKKDSSGYRMYKVKSTSVPDDYQAMYEVLSRRLAKDHLPDLLIVDGGKGQLNIALRVLKELNITAVDVLSIAKEESRHDKGIRAEKVFLPNRKEPIFLPTNSPILFLIQNIRDEAHRFAINFHRKRRSKKMVTSELDGIAGIGPVKKKRLLTTFGSLKAVKNASREQLLRVQGITELDVETLIQAFSKKR